MFGRNKKILPKTETSSKVKAKRTLLQKIVNVFLYTGIFILIIFLIAVGFSQTSTFREMLREKVIEVANNELNGKVYIGKIDGTIFTSLVLHNTVVSMGTDTLLNAESIEVRTSPLKILLKTIYFRHIEIDNAQIKFIKNKSGVLNLLELFIHAGNVDTSKNENVSEKSGGKFPFEIQVADLVLKNINFSLQSHENAQSKKVYPNLNTEDLQFKNLNMELSLDAEIFDNEYELVIAGLNFQTNLSGFNLKDLSGQFLIQGDKIRLNNLIVKTDSSDISLTAGADKLNLFNNKLELNKALLNVNLDASKFGFNDLSAFIPETNLLHGSVAVQVEAAGTLNKLNVGNLVAELPNSYIQAKCLLTNILDIDDLKIEAGFKNSFVDPQDLHDLLSQLNIPVYKDYGIVKFDTLNFSGNPLNFTTDFYAQTEKGIIGAQGSIDLTGKDINYNMKVFTKDVDIFPVTGISTNFNSRLSLKGKGVSPPDLEADIRLIGDGSTVEGNNIDTLRLTANAQKKNISFDVKANSVNTNALVNGTLDFTNEKNPAYDIKGELKNINLAKFTGDSTFQTNLNFSISAMGENFDPNKMDLFLSTKLYDSNIGGIHIDSTRAIVDLRKDEGGERIVNIVSDLADITLTGNFTVLQSVNLLSGEAGFLSTAVKDKLNEIIPPQSELGKKISVVENTPHARFDQLAGNGLPADSLISMKYAIEFKDFSLLSLFLGNNQLELDGDLTGELSNTSDSLKLSSRMKLAYLKFWGKEDVFFLSNLSLNLDMSNKFNSDSLKDVTANLEIKTDRVFTGSDFYNLLLDLSIRKDKANISFTGKLEDYASAKLTSAIDLTDSNAKIDIDTLLMKYNTFMLSNKEPILISYVNDHLYFNKFTLSRDGSDIQISGKLAQNSSQDLRIQVENFSAEDLFVNVLQYKPDEVPDADVNLDASLQGTLNNPLMDMNINIDHIKFRRRSLGALDSKFNYSNKDLKVDIQFLDTAKTNQKSPLSLTGHIPIDLSLQSVKERMLKNSPLNLTLYANNFNMGAFRNVLPVVKRLQGNLAAQISVTGTMNNISPKGYLTLRDAEFLLTANNLAYDAGLKVSVSKEAVSIDSLEIKNTADTQEGGAMRGFGSATWSNLDIKSFSMSLNGSLKVLSDASKSATHSIYGDLIVATNGNLQLQQSDQGLYLSAPISVKKANLTYLPEAAGYTSGSAKFVYKYVIDTTQLKSEMDFESLVNLARNRSRRSEVKAQSESKFHYSINVDIEEEATIVMVLSKELNQNLTAVLRGNFVYENLRGARANAQGTLDLLEGSTLEFIKTFKAEGSIKFEGDLANPILDITATYLDYYTPASDSSATAQETPVAVKIKIKGPLEDLGKTFIQESDNIAVYVGQKNIDNDVPDASKTPSDAIMFIIAGRFLEGATQQDRNTAAATATSLAGSIVGGLLNKQFGDYVRSLEFRQSGGQTRFNLSGKVQKFRYTIGGTTDVFQDISRANVRIEYPITNSFLIRLERKDAVSQTGIVNEMINELGLKYQFEF
jgi:hypothetical protein